MHLSTIAGLLQDAAFLLALGVLYNLHRPGQGVDDQPAVGLHRLALGGTGGFWTIYSSILMTGLLLRVPGVALLEKSLEKAKPAYRDCVESTSAFVPWFLRKKNYNGG